MAVNFQLPLATGGDGPLTYTATPLPAGLIFTASTRRVTGTPTTVQTVTTTYRVEDFDADADSVDFDWNVRAQLTLASLDTTGLDVEAAALLEANEAGTAGGDLYVDTDRGGTDTPLEGELGLGPDNTVISRIRRFGQTAIMFNDDNNPAAFDIGDYFDNAGNDLTMSLQTLADGLVQFPIAGALQGSNNDARARIILTAAAQTLMDNIATGDRFILAFTRPTPPPSMGGIYLGSSPIPKVYLGVTEISRVLSWQHAIAGLVRREPWH